MTPPRPTILAWNDAVDAILVRAEALRKNAPRAHLIIGVTGAVAAGKSTLARALSSVVVCTDHYLPDYDVTAEHLRDLPESSDLARLARDLAALREGHATDIPEWSFDSHSRVGVQRVESAPLIVCEGLHALHRIPRAHLDICVFVEAAQPVRWARCTQRERDGERGWSLEYLEHFFHTVADPTFAQFATEYRAGADFVIVNEHSA